MQRRDNSNRLGFVSPPGGTAYSVDPIALLRGAPNRELGIAFMEYVLSPEGQKLWNFKPETPGGPARFALRRLPVRRDFYAQEEWKPFRSDPDASPYTEPVDENAIFVMPFTRIASSTRNVPIVFCSRSRLG